MTNPIQQALAKLDPKNDAHWTSDGSPRMDVVHELTGNADLKRADITKAAPTFTRENPAFAAPEGASDPATAQGDTTEPVAPVEKADEQTEERMEAPEGDNLNTDQANAAQGDDEGDDAQAADADDATDPLFEALAEDPYDPALDEAVSEADAKLAEAQAALDEAKKVHLAAEKERDAAIEARSRETTPRDSQIGIMAYLQTQHEQRARRAGNAADLKSLGIDLKQFDPRSQIDKSMARKTGFGNRARPQVPAAGGKPLPRTT